MADRPLSPHLSIWKWGPHMAVSILHRVSGDGLAFVGIPVLLWWLGALASGPEAYARFTDWMWADLARLQFHGLGAILVAVVKVLLKIVMVGLSWAFFNHLCSGIRHFVLDMGAGFELETNKTWSVLSIAGGLVLTAAFWAAIVWK